MDQPPPGVLLKNMTPCEEMDISFYLSVSGHVRMIPMNLRCVVCRQEEVRQQI